MNNEPTPINAIHLNDGTHGLPRNPRFIRDERFRALCVSVRDNPEYMLARPIIVDEDRVILGGNMRYRACKDLGIDPLPAGWVLQVTGWPLEKKRRFILLDNRPFGEDDVDVLKEWGLSFEDLVAAGYTEAEADLTGLDAPEPEKAEKEPGLPGAAITFPPRVWLAQRAEIMAAITQAISGFGGNAAWTE